MQLIHPQIAHYAEVYTTEESQNVKELIAVSEAELNYTDMLSGRQVGMLLKMLVRLSGARRILEVGTFTGYSALMMAEALPDNGELITCEVNERYREISEPFFAREPFKRKIRQIMGPALETMEKLNGEFDLIFLDADKINYPRYYPLIKARIKKGGILVVDNTFWGGEVLTQTGEKAKAIHRLNEMIRADANTEQIMLPVRDGVMVVQFLNPNF